jgi:glycosyltransferase involved in cell wall biosynthesis
LQFIEAGYVGCPVISARKFAIPEVVDDGRTGLLLDHLHSSTVASAMHWMLEHPTEYKQMRKAAWEKAHGQHSRAQFEKRLCSSLSESVSSDRMLVSW